MDEYWTLDLNYWTWPGINKQGLQICRFSVILGRRIRIRREKKKFGPLPGSYLFRYIQVL
jgi:hypothetical protein